MTNANTLADRVEGAEGPSYALDCEIWDLIYPGERQARFNVLTQPGKPYHKRLGPADMDGYVQPLRPFTASLDAAMTLVPADDELRAVFWQVGNDGAGGNPADYLCRILVCSHMTSNEYRATAATPALALVAAALRARNRSNTDV